MNQRFCPHCGYDLQLDSAIMIDDFMMMSSMAPLWWGELPVDKLTASERMICYTLMKAYPSPVRNDVMIDRLDSEAETHVVTVYICRIRKKLRQAGVPNPIIAAKGTSGRAYGWTTGRERVGLSAS